MNEIKSEQEGIVIPGDLVPVLADPEWHAHHHLMCLKERDRLEDELDSMKEANCELLRRVEKLEGWSKNSTR